MIDTCGSDEGWNDHRWSGPRPRRLYIEGGGPVFHQHCFRCGRDFITDPSSDRRFAVFVSALAYEIVKHANQIVDRDPTYPKYWDKTQLRDWFSGSECRGILDNIRRAWPENDSGLF
jgi:hypothetical protein